MYHTVHEFIRVTPEGNILPPPAQPSPELACINLFGKAVRAKYKTSKHKEQAQCEKELEEYKKAKAKWSPFPHIAVLFHGNPEPIVVTIRAERYQKLNVKTLARIFFIINVLA